MLRKRATYIVSILVVTLGTFCLALAAGPESVSTEPPASAVAADVLPGTWVWTWSGKIGREKTLIVTTLEIESVAESGQVTGTESVKFGDNDPFSVPFGDKSRVYSEDGQLRFRHERISGDARFVYDLMPDTANETLKGSFSRPGWTTDEAVFEKQ